MVGQPGRRSWSGVLAAVVATLVVAACGASGSGAPSADGDPARLDVVATTTILADLARQAGGDRVTVTSIVPAGGEVHTFDPSPTDAARLAAADLVVANGLGLDGWLTELAADAGSEAPIVLAGEGLHEDAYLSDGNGVPNPHLWLDPDLAADYVERIGDGLAAVDPAGAATYAEQVGEARQRLTALDGWANGRLAGIDPASRRLVAFHDALPYLARAFDLEIVDVVVPAPGQEPSAGDLAAIVDEIRRTGVPAIVTEVQFSDDVVRSIASETGAAVVSDLYTDSVGDPPLDTYESVMRWNVERLAAALGDVR
jgi:zinc/manganese transport system substrate-binding protein